MDGRGEIEGTFGVGHRAASGGGPWTHCKFHARSRVVAVATDLQRERARARLPAPSACGPRQRGALRLARRRRLPQRDPGRGQGMCSVGELTGDPAAHPVSLPFFPVHTRIPLCGYLIMLHARCLCDRPLSFLLALLPSPYPDRACTAALRRARRRQVGDAPGARVRALDGRARRSRVRPR